MNLFSFKNKPYLSFVFDIRDNSFSIAVTKLDIGKKPEIIYCQNFKIDNNNYVLDKDYKKSFIKTLDVAILSVRKNLVKIGNKTPIKKYFFFIGSPWSVSQSKMIKITKEKDFIIDSKFLEKIILTEENKIEKDIENKSNGMDWKMIEEKIIQSKLNGYKIEKIFNKKTKDIEIEVLVSFAPQDLLNKLSLTADNKNIKQQVNSCILSSFSFLRDLFVNKNNFLYIDVGEFITDVCVVRDDVVFGIISFPFGEKNIIQHISKTTSLSEDIVLSYINMECNDKCNKKDYNKMENLLNIGISKWFEKFNETIIKICSENDLPRNIFILPNTDLGRIFAERIRKNKDLELFKKFGIDTQTTIIEEKVLDDFIINGKVFRREPYIKMDIIFLNKNFNN